MKRKDPIMAAALKSAYDILMALCLVCFFFRCADGLHNGDGRAGLDDKPNIWGERTADLLWLFHLAYVNIMHHCFMSSKLNASMYK